MNLFCLVSAPSTSTAGLGLIRVLTQKPEPRTLICATTTGRISKRAVALCTPPIVEHVSNYHVTQLNANAVIASDEEAPPGNTTCSYPELAHEFPEMDAKFRKWLAGNPSAPYPHGHSFYDLWYHLFVRSPSYYIFKTDPLNHLSYNE